MYQPNIRAEAVCLSSLVWMGGVFHTYGKRQDLFAAELPDGYRFDVRDRSWTGQTMVYEMGHATLTIELRTTLPGVYFHTAGRELALRWMPSNDLREIGTLDGASRLAFTEFNPQGAQLLWLRCEARQFLLVASKPLTVCRTISHRHTRLQFSEPGAAILLVPLLGGMTRESCFAQAGQWLGMIENPPLRCDEEFSAQEDRINLRQSFPDAAFAPIPPMLSLLGNQGGLLELPLATQLAETVFGPYAVVAGPCWEGTIEAGWMQSKMRHERIAPEPLADLPDELQYAGDWTWDETSTMDRLLSLRTWAPLLGAMPAAVRARITARLVLPQPDDFRAALKTIREPSTGRDWAWLKDMWAEHGEVTYDPDWYNGLCLSGLARAAFCDDPELAASARSLAKDCREERAALTAYFEIFHDWQLCSAWSDPRGSLWLPDCAHNGMEGFLAEGALRDFEGGDGSGLRCLAAKNGAAFLAAIRWPAWLANVEPTLLHQFQPGDAAFLAAAHDDRIFGTNTIYLPSKLFPITPASRNPYHIAGHFPEYSALFKAHGPVEELRRLAAIWEQEFPQRYTDWITYYIGADWRDRFVSARDQEARIQAAVFYHLAPEVCSRLWILGETPQSVEARFSPSLNLAEQILVRGRFQLVHSQ